MLRMTKKEYTDIRIILLVKGTSLLSLNQNTRSEHAAGPKIIVIVIMTKPISLGHTLLVFEL